MQKGLIHVYCGDGKGKTTAAMGLILRALGNEMQAVLIQFLKNTPTGEVRLLETLPGVTVLRGTGSDKFVFAMTPEEKAETTRIHNENLQAALALVEQKKCDLLVLDEAAAALSLGLLDEALLRQLVARKPPNLELVITGRDPASFLTQAADYVTEMVKCKHPYDCDIPARRGIEF